MKKYFMIKEFAKLRGVHINSLLYYEKLGLFKPSFVNPQTKYRYYEAEQLPILDTIILCIRLGIPLKEMKNYVDEEGNLNFQELLVYGRKLAKRKMEEIQDNLNMIERSLDLISDHKEGTSKNGVYHRELAERHIMISEFFSTPGNAYVVEKATSKLYQKIQEQGFIPLLPAGVILHYIDETSIRYCVFLEVVLKEESHPDIICLPKGEYECAKIDLKETPRVIAEVPKYWEWENGMTIVVQNMYSDKYNFGSKPSEFQKIQVHDIAEA